MGFAGQVSLGQAGFYGIGAYVSSVLSVHAGFPLVASMIAAMAVAAPAAGGPGGLLRRIFRGQRPDRVRSVQKPQADEGSGRIGDRESGSEAGEESEGRKRGRNPEESDEPEVVKDPDLGRRIDIQG